MTNGWSIGIDGGALFIKVAGTARDGAEPVLMMAEHGGNPRAVLGAMLGEMGVNRIGRIGIVGSLASVVAGPLGMAPLDDISALIEGMRSQDPPVRQIMDIGAASLTLVRLASDGSFLGSTTNSLCASGTGSFLDEQRTRLSLAREEIEGAETIENPPTIAARCAVFAKSDLIHRQQEGHSRLDCWSGLCKGVVGQAVQTLWRGRPIGEGTAFVGGVALEREVVRWMRETMGDRLVQVQNPAFRQALGALRLASDCDVDCLERLVAPDALKGCSSSVPRRPRLTLSRSRYPSFEVEESSTDRNGGEVRIHTSLEALRKGDPAVYLGIDIGSTSTKAVVMAVDGTVLVDVYRRTAGDPVRATGLVLESLHDIEKVKGIRWDVKGVGTTGSGRKLVGMVIGADQIRNEITAHVTGTMAIDPSIDTIFEIGGQDSKYIRTRHGHLYDSTMNYICAAGTGSFVEEQARKLGFDIKDVGDLVMGLEPPVTSDRCTVFMEQDTQALIRDGFSREEAMAAVLCSVVQNYLSKVVGSRYRSKSKIFFQGATARNKALAAAFENLLDVEIVVSPLCHVIGAYGAALLTRQALQASGQPSTFRGLESASNKVTLAGRDMRPLLESMRHHPSVDRRDSGCAELGVYVRQGSG